MKLIKYFTKLEVYKASNLSYCARTEIALSYEWYVLAKRINGQMVLNNYYYSPTTNRHYHKIRYLFDALGIDYITIQAPKGLQNKEAAIQYHTYLINDLKIQMQRPRSKPEKNIIRQATINQLEADLSLIKSWDM